MSNKIDRSTRKPNRVTIPEINEAIDYLFVAGYVEEMTSDKRHYTTILLKHAANTVGIKLEWK